MKGKKDKHGWLFSVEVYLTHLASGETVILQTEIYGWDEYEPSDYEWSEGNFSCDCNRSLLFYQAKGLTIDEIREKNLESPCNLSKTQEYQVDKIVCQNQTIYSEPDK